MQASFIPLPYDAHCCVRIGEVLDFWGVSRDGGKVVFFHPDTGKRWRMSAKKVPGKMPHMRVK